MKRVYREFDVAVPGAIHGCPCCIGKRGVDALLATPLRELTGGALWSYVSGVFLTVGDVADFRYLLPRILELSIVDPGSANDVEIVLGKFGLVEYASWSVAERRAIEDLLDAWFDHAIKQDLAALEEGWCASEAESVLCGAARGGFPITRWLLRLHEPWAEPVLTDLRTRFRNEMSPFWEDVPERFQEVAAVCAQGRA